MKRMVSILLTLLLLCSLALPIAAAAETAATLRLEKTEGTVKVSNASGKSVTVTKGMRLYSGYTIATEKGSYAYVSLDSTKVVKLDASSKAEVQKSGKKLELTVAAGKLFFNVTAPVEKDESLNIRTSTMVTGVRGTSGWVEVVNRFTSRVHLLEGTLTVTSSEPATGQMRQATITSGQTATATLNETSRPGSQVTLTVTAVQEKQVPGFVAVEVAADLGLQGKIAAKSPLSVPAIIGGAQERLAEEQKAADTAQKTLDKQLAAIGADEVKQVFESPTVIPDDDDGDDGGQDSDPTPDPTPDVSLDGPTAAELKAALETDGVTNVAVTNAGAYDLSTESYTVSSGQTLNIQSGTFDVGSGQSLTVNGTLVNSGTVNVAGTMDVAGTADIAGTMNVGGDLNVTGTMNVDGTANVGGTMNVYGDLNVANTMNVDGNLDVAGTMNVGGDLTVNGAGTMDVAGTADVTGTMDIGGTADVAGTMNVGGDLTVNGAGTMNVDGALNVNAAGTVDVAGTADVGGTMNVDGTADVGGTMNVDGDLNVAGTMNVDGDLNVAGTMNISGTVENNGTITITSTESVHVLDGGTLINYKTILVGDGTNSGLLFIQEGGNLKNTGENAMLKISTTTNDPISSQVVNEGTFTNSGSFNVSDGTLFACPGEYNEERPDLYAMAKDSDDVVRYLGLAADVTAWYPSTEVKMLGKSGGTFGPDPYTDAGVAFYELTAANVTLDLNGHAVELLSGLTIPASGGNLTITDSSVDKTGTLSLADTAGGNTVTVSGGSLTLSGGTVAGGAKNFGINALGGTVTISGGTVSSDSDGGIAVKVDNANTQGTVLVTGGEITSSGIDGLAMEVSSGTVNMSGGRVSASGTRGIGMVAYGGVINVSDGEVSSADSIAMGIDGGEVNISGGKVTDASGIGIKERDGMLMMTGGEVSSVSGTAMTVDGGAAIISGGTVTSTSGTGIAETDGRLNMTSETDPSGNVISGTVIGGNMGISVSGGELTMEGGTVSSKNVGISVSGEMTGNVEISGGSVSGSNHGVYIDTSYNSDSAVSISGGTVTSTSGTGIEVTGGRLNMISKTDPSGNVISGTVTGGNMGISVSGGELTMEGGTVFSNNVGISVNGDNQGTVYIYDGSVSGGSYGVRLFYTNENNVNANVYIGGSDSGNPVITLTAETPKADQYAVAGPVGVIKCTLRAKTAIEFTDTDTGSGRYAENFFDSNCSLGVINSSSQTADTEGYYAMVIVPAQ